MTDRLPFEKFTADLKADSKTSEKRGRWLNISFVFINVVAVIVAAVALSLVIYDYLGIGNKAALIALIPTAIFGMSKAFRLREKSDWYFQYERLYDYLYDRIKAGTVNYADAVEEKNKAAVEMDSLWTSISKSIDPQGIINLLSRKDR
jgi:hypothetical protein